MNKEKIDHKGILINMYDLHSLTFLIYIYTDTVQCAPKIKILFILTRSLIVIKSTHMLTIIKENKRLYITDSIKSV